MSTSYRDLVVWQVGVELVTHVYRATETFPKHETYGLAGQMRRAAVSIPSNIAEGQGRNSQREFQQFLAQAKGSLAELETQITIGHNLGYLSHETVEKLLQECERASLLHGLLNSLRKREHDASKNGKRETSHR